MELAFVVLHYNTINETLGCIKSIKDNIDTKSYRIVVVDNGSPNHSGLELKRYFEEDSYVDVILVKENIGFARGNNTGIHYSRTNLHAEFICCLNNDTILSQHDFFEIIKDEYLNTGAALIGPQVIRADGTVQKFSSKIMDAAVYKKLLLALTKESRIEYLKMKIKSSKLFKYVNAIRRQAIGIEENPFIEQDNVLLHGCCLIFTPSFFQVLSGFDNRTFLYREEELLYLSIKEKKLTTRYTPRLKILHLEDASTNSISTDKDKKDEFKQQCLIESTRILIDTLESRKIMGEKPYES